jgi:hypothetical protein
LVFGDEKIDGAVFLSSRDGFHVMWAAGGLAYGGLFRLFPLCML